MENVLLVIHLIVTLALIIFVLLQRSEGGGLVNSSGGLGNFASARSTGNALTRGTAILAAIFFATNLTLAIMAKDHAGTSDVLKAIEQVEEKKAAAPVNTGVDKPATESGAGKPAPAQSEGTPEKPSAPLAD